MCVCYVSSILCNHQEVTIKNNIYYQYNTPHLSQSHFTTEHSFICKHCQYPEYPVFLYSCILIIAAIELRT